MVLTTEHKIYMIEAYFKTGVLVNGTWEYSQRLCLDNFREHFPAVGVLPENVYPCFTNCVEVFRETGSEMHKKGAGRPRIRTEGVINDVRQAYKTFKTSLPRNSAFLWNLPNDCEEEPEHASI
ncbi:camp-dependent protein kinase regulatory chain [Holotrichia oblita]|uniref:Camp-dependent protein kinase regulatory chain n=1 Tax=Holotrichia oblita TaxID=644536 RepID=A0ACB9TR38_HOLOL|nr:camp-dependent protein kinase regulatory chain [Holotrichia oblita]